MLSHLNPITEYKYSCPLPLLPNDADKSFLLLLCINLQQNDQEPGTWPFDTGS